MKTTSEQRADTPIDPIALADEALARKVYKTIEESWRATAPQRQALLESEIIPDELWYKTWR